ncbi:MAG: isochorismatase family protein [Erysipelotrichales bacterium]|nr:isochorismatase family protein [Erysipelotrichales bacterium]
MNKFNLVIVDLQYDFYDSCGSMTVPGACNLPEKIGKFIEEHKDEINRVIFTLDWHYPSHSSFEENGGKWPTHCVQYTKGASLPSELVNKISNLGLHIQFIEKAHYEEEYGAFENIQYRWNKYDIESSNYYRLFNRFDDSCIAISAPDKRMDFVVCGLCGDYCVMETMKNLMKEPNFTIKAYKEGILSMDNGEKFDKFIEENNIEVVE